MSLLGVCLATKEQLVEAKTCQRWIPSQQPVGSCEPGAIQRGLHSGHQNYSGVLGLRSHDIMTSFLVVFLRENKFRNSNLLFGHFPS